MEDKPTDVNVILNELKEFESKDLDYADGHILGSMCTEPHPFAKKVFINFLNANLGDPGLFKGTFELEKKVIKSLGDLLSLENPYGNIVTGGTEANLMAVRAARNYARDYEGIVNGEIILPKSAHFSFKKATDLMDLKIVEVDLDENYKMDLNSLKDCISKNTVAIVAVAGTTELGMVDPIEKISEIAIENDIYLHVDAAFGGFSIPFLKLAGFNLPKFDFELEGVCSITIDPHKMGLAPIPSGGIIFRDKKYLDLMSINSPYLTIKTQSTIVGTRLGASSAATYAIMKYFGKEGYCKLIKNLMNNTSYLKEGLDKLGYEVIVNPELNLVCFNHPNIEAHVFEKILEEKGWMVSVTKYPLAIRIVLMNHIKKEHLNLFLKDLEELI